MTYRPKQPDPTIKGSSAPSLFRLVFVAAACAGIAYLMGWWRP